MKITLLGRDVCGMAIIQCKECGKEVSDQATTCPNCGAPTYPTQPQTVYQQVPPQQQYASYPPPSQAQQYPPQPQYAQYPAPVPMRPKKKRKAWVVLGIIYLLIMLIVFIPDSTIVSAQDSAISFFESALIYLVFAITPFLLISNLFGIRDKLPLFKKRKTGTTVLGCLILLVVFAISINIAGGLHTDEYRVIMQEQLEIRQEEARVEAERLAAERAEKEAAKAAETAAKEAAKVAELEKPTADTPIVEVVTDPAEQLAAELSDYEASCESITYKDLLREPEKHTGKRLKITVEISQIMSGGILTESGYRAYANGYSDEWYIAFSVPDGQPRILKDDTITFYGEFKGVVAMTRALTNTKDYVPRLEAKYYEIAEGDPTAGEGSIEEGIYGRSNPAPIGTLQTIKVSDYSNSYTADMTVDEVLRGAAAWEKIQAENPFNPEPEQGKEYILATITAKITEEQNGKAIRLSNFNFDAFSGTNSEYSTPFIVTPKPDFSGELYEGGTLTGYMVFTVDISDSAPKIAFERNYDGTGGIWFSIAE